MTTDVAIVGGGVAAAAAVIALEGSGRSVCVIAPPENREINKIGESLSPSATPILRQLGVLESFRDQGHQEAQTSFSAWGMDQITQRSAMMNLDGPGWQIDRQRFEKLLWHRALEVGFQRVDSNVQGAQRVGADWQVETVNGHKIEASFLLDCSGRAAVIARQLSKRVREDRQLAAYAFLDQLDQGIQATPGSMVESRPDSWWYSALLPGGHMVVAQFFDRDLMPSSVHKCADSWRTVVEDTVFTERRIRTAGYSIESKPTIADASTMRLLEPAGEHWAAVGDAAAAFDPLSSHGMTTALWSGQAAALAAVKTLAGDPKALSSYCLQVANGVEQFLRQRKQVYAMERRFADEAFWRRRHGIQSFR